MTARKSFSKFSDTANLRADLKSRSIRGAATVASCGALEMVLRFLSIVVLSRLLLPEDFGLVAMVAAVTGLLDSFRDLGLSTATIQRPEITHRQVSSLFWVNVLLGTTMMLTVSALSPVIANFYGDSRLIPITLTLSLAFLLGGLGVQHEALMTRQLRQGELAVIRLLANAVSTAIAIGLALTAIGYWALVLREVSRSMLILSGVWLRCRWLPGAPRFDAEVRGMVRFGAELSATGVFIGMIANVDKILIGRVFGVSSAGIYRQAQQLLVAPIDQLNGPIMSVAEPALSALHDDPIRYRRYYEKIVFLVATATFPLGLYVALYSEEVTLLLLGRSWLGAAPFVCIFGILAMMRPAIATSAVVLITRGFSKRFLILAVLHGAVLMILLVAGASVSATGIAWAHVGATALMMLPKLYYSFLHTPATLGGFFRAVRAPIIAGAVMCLVLLAVRSVVHPNGVLPTIIIGAIGGYAAYGLSLWAQRTTRSEIRSLLVDVRSALDRR